MTSLPTKSLVLVVDDDVLQLRMFSSLLSRNYYCVLTASSGSEALRVLNSLHQNHQLKDLRAVVLDVMMPEIDGLSVLKVLQSRYPQVAVIMCSSLNERSVVVTAMKLGATDYIVKPYRPDILLRKLDQLAPSPEKDEQLRTIISPPERKAS